MPAAIQAEVITAAVGTVQVMGPKYAGGPGRFRYLLYKDVNRQMPLRPLT